MRALGILALGLAAIAEPAAAQRRPPIPTVVLAHMNTLDQRCTAAGGRPVDAGLRGGFIPDAPVQAEIAHHLPDPLEKLAELLGERVNGTQSLIHGDLNTNNILVKFSENKEELEG